VAEADDGAAGTGSAGASPLSGIGRMRATDVVGSESSPNLGRAAEILSKIGDCALIAENFAVTYPDSAPNLRFFTRTFPVSAVLFSVVAASVAFFSIDSAIFPPSGHFFGRTFSIFAVNFLVFASSFSVSALTFGVRLKNLVITDRYVASIFPIFGCKKENSAVKKVKVAPIFSPSRFNLGFSGDAYGKMRSLFAATAV
jgi:hypothetical protein